MRLLNLVSPSLHNICLLLCFTSCSEVRVIAWLYLRANPHIKWYTNKNHNTSLCLIYNKRYNTCVQQNKTNINGYDNWV